MNVDVYFEFGCIVLDDFFKDGCQFDIVLKIWCGMVRMLWQCKFVCFFEVMFVLVWWVDLLVFGFWYEFWIVEVKLFVVDFRVDYKWFDYWQYCDWLFFVIYLDVLFDIFFEEVGLIVLDGFGVEILCEVFEYKVVVVI